MKNIICKVINFITFGKVCFGWCEVEKVEVKKQEVKKPVVEGPKKEVKKAAKKPAKKTTKTAITKEMKKQFVKDKASGMSYKAIAQKHGVSASSVSYHIKKSK